MNVLVGDIGNKTTKICLIKKNNFKIKKIIYFDSKDIISNNKLSNNFKKIIKGRNINKKALFSIVVPKYKALIKK